MLDETRKAIIDDLNSHLYTQGDIACKYNISRKTVCRLIKELDMQIGRGIKNYWAFDHPSVELAYIIGAYLTDGHIANAYVGHSPTAFILSSTTPEYTNKLFVCFKTIGLNPKLSESRNSVGRLGEKPQFVVSVYSSMFSRWLFDNCNKKSSIPRFIYNSPIDQQAAFLSGAIDGDGSVGKDGSIWIRGIDKWLIQLPSLLNVMNIKTRGVRLVCVLDSGKRYRSVSIKRSDFRSLSQCAITVKQNRILYGKDARQR